LDGIKHTRLKKSTPEMELQNVKKACGDENTREECKNCGHHFDQKTPTYLSVISSGFHKGNIFNVDPTVTDRIRSSGM
jgi:methionyl-tRNA synthetase